MSQIISSPATITQNPRTSYRVYNEEAVIIHHDIKEMIRLNPVASFIWELVKSPLQFDQIVKSVSEIFEVDESVAVDDIKDFIDTYTRYGLLKIDGNEVSEPTRQALDESPSISKPSGSN
jgi:hypothetical protein